MIDGGEVTALGLSYGMSLGKEDLEGGKGVILGQRNDGLLQRDNSRTSILESNTATANSNALNLASKKMLVQWGDKMKKPRDSLPMWRMVVYWVSFHSDKMNKNDSGSSMPFHPRVMTSLKIFLLQHISIGA